MDKNVGPYGNIAHIQEFSLIFDIYIYIYIYFWLTNLTNEKTCIFIILGVFWLFWMFKGILVILKV